MLQGGEFEDSGTDFAECAVCWTDTQLRCGDCGDPVCHNCAHCPNGCRAKTRPSMISWEWLPFAAAAAVLQTG